MFTRNGEEPGRGEVNFILGRMGNFKVSLHSWKRGANAPILLIPPTSLSPPTPTPTAPSVVMFLWLNGWSRHIWCAILLNDNMDLHMSSLHTLVPEGSWCMFYAKRHQFYWGLTHNVSFYWYSDFVITYTKTHNTVRGQ